RQPLRQRERRERLLRARAQGLRARGRAVRAVRDADPPRGVHEPLLLQLPALPAPPAGRGRRGPGGRPPVAPPRDRGPASARPRAARPAGAAGGGRRRGRGRPAAGSPSAGPRPRIGAAATGAAGGDGDPGGSGVGYGWPWCAAGRSATRIRRFGEEGDAMGAGGERVRLTAWVRGRVQGVGFRWWTRARALELGLTGAATNLADGRVEVVAEGGRDGCARLLELLEG